MRSLGYFFLNLVQAIFLVTWSVIWISTALIGSILSPRIPFFLARNVWSTGLIWGAGAKMLVEQNPKVEQKKTYIFVSNHQSMFDVPALFAHIPHDLRFVAKRVLLFVPFLGWYMWRTKMVFVDRADSSQAHDALEKAAGQIRDGTSIIAFPEGTRSPDGRVKRLKRGIFLLARASGVPIVPVAIEGSGDLLPKGGFRIRPRQVRLKIGEPIVTSEFGTSRQEIERLRNLVQERLVALHDSIGGPNSSSEEDAFNPNLNLAQTE